MATTSKTKMSSKGQTEFDSLIAKARRQGKKAGLKQSDIRAAIAKLRKNA